MKYFLLIKNAEGESRLVPIADLSEIAVAPGDEIVVMDENGNPADVSLRPDGNDLAINFKNGESVVLKEFYEIGEGGKPITISLNPKEPAEAIYEFNSQTGNLPNAKSFTLMRYSNTEYVDFVEQLDELNLGRFSGTHNVPGFGGGGGGHSPNVAPEAVDDAGETDQNTPLVITVLANDTDPNPNDALVVKGVDQPARGSVSINAENQLIFDPGNDFVYLGAGESEVVSFNYSIFDGNGGTDTATVTIIVHGVDDASITAPDSGVTNEDTPVTIDVLANDYDPDTNENPLWIDSVTQPVLGFVTNNINDVTFAPGTDFNYLAAGETATVTFTYTTNTGVTENVTVTINGVNDAPDANDDDRSTDQNTPLLIDALSNDTDPDASDALIITGVTQPGKGTVTYNAGDLTFDPGSDFDSLGAGESETVTFTYSISDGNGGTDTATITVTINGVDDATITAPDAAVTNEDTPVTINVLANDSDVDASDNPLTITSVTQPALGSVVNNGANVTFDPGSDFQNLAKGETATVTFTYTTDTGATENVTVTINGLNDGPDAIDDDRTTDQDSAIIIDAIANDTDPDASDLLLIIGVDQPSLGTASINASNQIVFDPGNEFDYLGAGESATVTFNYTISDGNGGTDTATITVTINGVDDATVTAPDAATTNEDTPVVIDVLANDSDADASDNPLSITAVTQPALGSVVNNGTNVTFDPGSDFQNLAVGETATVTFTYTTDTGATENVTVTINGVNDGPDAIDDARTTDQDTAIVIDAIDNDTDVDGSDVLLITGVDQPARGTASINGSNQIVFDPGNDFDELGAGESATVTFNYSISDGNGGTDTATITVTINGVDDATVTAPDAAVTDEDTPVVIDVLANDSDADTTDNPLSITSVTQPSLGSVVNNGTNVTFNPGSDFQNLAVGETATVTFTYTTNTGATENVTVTITGLNDGPDAVDDAESTDQNSIVTINLVSNDTDPDGDTLVIAQINGIAAGGTITLPSGALVTVNANGTVDYNPNGIFDSLDAGESAIDTFTYTISDGNGGTDTATATVTINGVDDATVTAPDVATTNEDTPVTIDVLANDSDADASDNPLSITAVTQPALGSVVNNGTNVTFNPGSDFQNLAVGETATVTFTYTTNTGATENVTVTINGLNDGPDAIDDDRTTDQDTAITINAIDNDTDPDASDVLLIIGVDQPSQGSASINASNQIVFDPGNEFDYLGAGESAAVTFNYTISDGNGGTDTATITVTINGVDDATVTAPDAAETDEDTPVVIDVLANDSDPDTSDNPLSITAVTQPALGSVVNNGTNVTFNPGSDFQYLAAGESATVTFTYTTDTGVTENVTVTITGLNDAPTAIDDAADTDQDSAIVINAIANDTDPDGSDLLLIVGVDQPSRGSSYINASNQIVFDPGNEFDYLGAGESATVTFNYTISDGNGGTDTATITVTVQGLDDPTVTAPDTDTTDEDTPVTIDVLANDSDVDLSDNPLTIASVTQPVLGLVTHNGATLTFDPDGDFETLSVGDTATVTFTYTTNTGATENVTVTITGVNDAPVANDDIVVSTTDIIPVSINVISNDTDVDGTVVASSVDLDPGTPGIQTTLTVAGEGTWTTNGAGVVTFTPTAGINNQPTPITYEITDNDGGTSQATIDLKYSAADVWFGNDESGSVSTSDFNQSRNLISGAANQMSFATGELAFNAAVFSWANSTSQQMAVALTDDKAAFVNDSANYSRNYGGWTDIGQGIVFGTQQILASVAARQLANHPRAGVPQVMVILTDATSSQILNDTSLLADAQAAKNAGIILVFVAIQEAQQDPVAVARLQQAASVDQNGDPFVITATNYADIGPATIADLLNEIREAAAAGLLPPIVIDLDGDGVEFRDIDNGILFDVDGDGVMEQVAWAGNDDAVLVYDANGNNDVDGVHEIAFARYSSNPNATDLEGLRFFDTNEDLILDANDAEFESFKLWQDRNGNGIVDEGEMMTLSEAGIKSIELTSDGSTYYTAGGDVKVNGTAVVHYEDGSTGEAADAEFGYRELIETDDSIEIMTSEGDVLDLSSNPNSSDPGSDPVGLDLLEPSGGPADDSGEFSGGPVTTSLDDDLAAAGANVS